MRCGVPLHSQIRGSLRQVDHLHLRVIEPENLGKEVVADNQFGLSLVVLPQKGLYSLLKKSDTGEGGTEARDFGQVRHGGGVVEVVVQVVVVELVVVVLVVVQVVVVVELVVVLVVVELVVVEDVVVLLVVLVVTVVKAPLAKYSRLRTSGRFPSIGPNRGMGVPIPWIAGLVVIHGESAMAYGVGGT